MDSSRLLTLALAATATILIAGCDEPHEVEEPVVETVEFETIGRGRNAQLQDTTEITVRNAERWRTLTDSLSPLGSLHEADFDQQDVLLIALPVTSGGYDLTVDAIERVDGDLRVRYTVEEPGEDCLAAQVVLTPFVAVAIDKTDSDPTFVARRDRYSCSVRQR